MLFLLSIGCTDKAYLRARQSSKQDSPAAGREPNGACRFENFVRGMMGQAPVRQFVNMLLILRNSEANDAAEGQTSTEQREADGESKC